MTNLDIRKVIADRRLRHYEVAHAIGISEFTFSRKLRQELPEDEKQRVLRIINELAREVKSNEQ